MNEPAPLTAAELALFHSADEVFFGRLLVRLDGVIRRVAAQYHDDPDDIEDQVQAIRVRIWERRLKFRGGSIEAWAHTLARPCCLNAVRDRGSHAEHDVAVRATVSVDCEFAETDEEVAAREEEHDDLWRRLDEALGQLTDHQREILDLVYGDEEMTSDAVAGLLGSAPSTVRRVKQEALRKLRHLLEERQDRKQ